VGCTLFRAGERQRGIEAVERAVASGAGEAGVLARALMAKRTGDRAGALRDFEAMAARASGPEAPVRGELSRQDARVHLELAKLYEHHAREPARALDIAHRGTGEAAEDARRRIARLERKMRRAPSA
jgi:hypothetical protein